MNNQELVFDWGTIKAQTQPKISIYVPVNYADVAGKLMVGDILQIDQKPLRYEVVGFGFDEDKQDHFLLELTPCKEDLINQKTSFITYTVDVPSSNLGHPWINVASFDTEEEAISFVQDHYGGDDQGRVSLVSEFDEP